MSLSALLPHWEPKDKGDGNADNWYLSTCRVFKELSKKQLKNLKVGSLKEGYDACFIDTYTLAERTEPCMWRMTGSILCSLALFHFGGDNHFVTI